MKNKDYTLSIGATVRKNGLPEVGDKIQVKETKLFKSNYAMATVLRVESEDVNLSGNIRHTVTTDLGTASVWHHEVAK